MWTSSQTALLEQLCELAGIRSAAPELLRTGKLAIDGVAFSLLPGLLTCSLRVIVQLGDLPDEEQPAVCRRLLELNLFIDGGNHEQLALERGTGKVLFSYQFNGSSASLLLLSLRRAVAQAIEWRESYFMDSDVGVLAS